MPDQLHLKWGWIAWTLIAAVAGFVCGVATLPARGAEAEDRSSLSPATPQPSAIEPQADEILRAAGNYLAEAKSFTFAADGGATMFSYNGIYYQPAFQNGVTVYTTVKV